jgi:hypothetical protein
MAVEASWRANMRVRGRAVVDMTLLSVLCGATQAAAGGASTRSRVIPLPAAVALYGPHLSGQGLGVSNHAK